MNLTLDQIRKHFRKRGLKFTNQRYAIYRALAASDRHPSAEDLFAKVKRTFPALSMNTVYNTLEALQDVGVASEISLWHDRARFDANQSPHHHLVCLGCKKIEDLYDRTLDGLSPSARASHDYRITARRIEFHGYCGDCQRKLKNKTGSGKSAGSTKRRR
jgi:Fur family transcriptional regulator, peroxide stress response regulator